MEEVAETVSTPKPVFFAGMMDDERNIEHLFNYIGGYQGDKLRLKKHMKSIGILSISKLASMPDAAVRNDEILNAFYLRVKGALKEIFKWKKIADQKANSDAPPSFGSRRDTESGNDKTARGGSSTFRNGNTARGGSRTFRNGNTARGGSSTFRNGNTARGGSRTFRNGNSYYQRRKTRTFGNGKSYYQGRNATYDKNTTAFMTALQLSRSGLCIISI